MPAGTRRFKHGTGDFPHHHCPVIQSDRVKRAKPRKDSGRDSHFRNSCAESRKTPRPAAGAGGAAEAAEAAPAKRMRKPRARRLPRDDGRAAAPFKK